MMHCTGLQKKGASLNILSRHTKFLKKKQGGSSAFVLTKKTNNNCELYTDDTCFLFYQYALQFALHMSNFPFTAHETL